MKRQLLLTILTATLFGAGPCVHAGETVIGVVKKYAFEPKEAR